MQLNIDAYSGLYNELKFWGSVGGIFWTVFRGYTWIKEIKDNHLTHIQSEVTEFNKKLDVAIASQTEKLVSATDKNTQEIRALREDIKMLTNAILMRK